MQALTSAPGEKSVTVQASCAPPCKPTTTPDAHLVTTVETPERTPNAAWAAKTAKLPAGEPDAAASAPDAAVEPTIMSCRSPDAAVTATTVEKPVRSPSTAPVSTMANDTRSNPFSVLFGLDETADSGGGGHTGADPTAEAKQECSMTEIFRGWRKVARCQAAAKRQLGRTSAAMMRKMRVAFDMISKCSLRRGLQIVPPQAACRRWQYGLARAAKAADALRQRQLRSALGAWKRRADGAAVKRDLIALDGKGSTLVISCAVLGVISVIYFAPIAMARNMMLLLTSLRGSLVKKIGTACSVAAAPYDLFLRRHTARAKLQACRFPLAHILPRIRCFVRSCWRIDLGSAHLRSA